VPQQAAPKTRVTPAGDAGERELLTGFLDWYRETVLWKLDGLPDDQLRRRLVPSQTNLLGLVKHLGYVERGWFRRRFKGEDLADAGSQSDPDADFRIEPHETTASVIAFYRDAIACSRAIVAAAASLDEIAQRPSATGKLYTRTGQLDSSPRRRQPTVRWTVTFRGCTLKQRRCSN